MRFLFLLLANTTTPSTNSTISLATLTEVAFIGKIAQSLRSFGALLLATLRSFGATTTTTCSAFVYFLSDIASAYKFSSTTHSLNTAINPFSSPPLASPLCRLATTTKNRRPASGFNAACPFQRTPQTSLGATKTTFCPNAITRYGAFHALITTFIQPVSKTASDLLQPVC